MRVRHALAATSVVMTAPFVAACEAQEPEEERGRVRITGQSFAEGALVAEMYSLLLSEAGYEPTIELREERDDYLTGLGDGDFDLAPEYLGAIADALHRASNGEGVAPISRPDAAETLAAADPLFAKAGIALLDVAEASDTNAFFVTQEYADAHAASRLTDLEGRTVRLAAPADCAERMDCERGLEQHYGITVSAVIPRAFASRAAYDAVKRGAAELGLTSTTDGTLEQQGLVLLVDDLAIQPAQNLVPAGNADFLAEHPGVEEALAPLMETLTTQHLVDLNERVSVDGEHVDDVARDYLEEHDLL